MNPERPQTPSRKMRPDGGDYVQAKGLRSPSSSSDIVSSSGRSILGGPLPQASPNPAYIVQSAAEQLTSTELDRPVTVSENALDLVNEFLDQQLYNLLHLAKSTDIDSLRQAVPKLLKPRLGQAAINAADEELRDYIKDEVPENLQRPPRLAKPSDFDLELAWKLARLRCMVYARLGDMEEEDEEEYLDSERLAEHSQGSPMSVVLMSAIFLTSILEFVGEQALCNAAQHAERRHNSSARLRNADEDAAESISENIAIEPTDMLQLGREGPLSRLWRSWRRDTRAPELFASRPTTPGHIMSSSMNESSHSRKTSHASYIGKIPEEDSPVSAPTTPSRIPLPMRDRDIDEIEVPGLAPDFEEFADGEGTPRPELGKKRPSSMLIMPGDFPTSAGPASPTTPTSPTVPERSALRPSFYRKRSQSVPLPPSVSLRSPKPPPDMDSAIIAAPTDDSVAEVEDPQVRDQDQDQDQPPTQLTPNGSAQASRPTTQQSTRASAVNGAAVAAIAGALGVEAARASRRNKEPTGDSRPQTPRNRTAAEEMMGSSYQASAPHGDAQTGATITGPSDFESLQAPHNANADVDVDDPEDLALSSSDGGNTRDSGFAMASAPVASAPASPSSPRRNREAAVYENSIVSSPRERESEFTRADDNRPRTQESVTFQPAELAAASHTDDEYTDNATDLPLQRPEQSNDTPALTSSIPPRMSSREPRYGHSAKSSTYSQHSKSSSSSSKLLGFTRDPSGRPVKDNNQTLHSRDGSAGTSRVIPAATLGAAAADPIAARREHLRLRPDSEDDAARTRSLEILIKSDETLHYTLTPESARASEFPRSPTLPKTETQDLADFLRNTGPPGDPSTTVAESVRASQRNMSGLRSKPMQYNTVTTAVASKPVEVQASDPPQSPRARMSAAPRDPRPERNTTRDLADYVRSTGPTNEEQLPQSLGTRSSAVGLSESANTSKRPDGVPRAPPESQRPSNVSSNSNRSKFQARDARPTKGAETADLIDFIRQGPPRAAGEHRIDRQVAPFRTTMDSDDLQALAPPGDLTGRSSVGSTHESSATKSMQESTNSRTALLDSSRQTPVRNTLPISHDVKRQVIPEQDGMPPRTRRRVRDPYAIDFSDDEELEEEMAPPKPRKEEESLIDFLRNTAPPPGMTTQPILATGARPQEKPEVKRSASKSKLRDMLGGDSSSRNGGMALGANGDRENSPHLYQRPNGASASNGVRKPRFEAREAKTTVTSTSDLADYLKHSGPSESTQSLPNNRDPKMMHSAVKEQAGFMKFFSRKGSVRR